MAEGNEKQPMYRYLLWENPHAGSWDPSTDGDIILSSDNYDYLEFEMRITGGNPVSHIRRVGNIVDSFCISIQSVDTGALGNNFIMGRTLTYLSRTRFKITTGIVVRWAETVIGTNNSFAVPVKIYGIKYS